MGRLTGMDLMAGPTKLSVTAHSNLLARRLGRRLDQGEAGHHPKYRSAHRRNLSGGLRTHIDRRLNFQVQKFVAQLGFQI
jgi:hypothetical protein